MKTITFDKYTSYAKWYEIFIAKIFGEKVIGYDGDFKITAYFYKGKQYISEIK